MKVKLTGKDILWSYIGTFLSMGANIIILPFLMYYLDENMLGLWYIFAGVGGIATLFDFGFSVTFARNITYCWSGAKKLKKEDVEFVDDSEPDYYMMKQVLTTCKVIYGILAGGAYVLLLTIGTGYIAYVSREVGGRDRFIAWFIYSTAAFLNLYFGYYNSFLRGVGAVDRASKNAVISKCVQIVLTVGLLVCKIGIIGPCVAYLAYGTLFRMLGKHYFYSYENIKEKLDSVSTQIKKEQIINLLNIVWHNAWRDGIISICNYFCDQASTVICSMYLPLSQTGIYSLGVQIATAIAQVAGTLYNAYQPELQSAYISSNTNKLRKTMAMIIMSFSYLFVIGMIIVSTVGIPILKIIKPSVVVSVPVLLGLGLYQYILKFRNCYTSYFSCTNRILYMPGFIVSAILCVVLSFIAIGLFDFGVWGLICAQIISQAVYNLWKWPSLANKEMGLNAISTISEGTKETINLIKQLLNNKLRKA